MDLLLLYIEINVFCILVALVVLIKSFGITQMASQRIFTMSLISMILFIASDMIAYVLQTVNSVDVSFGVMVCKAIYFNSTTVMCYMWMLYFEYVRGDKLSKDKEKQVIKAGLCIIQFVLTMLNFKFGFFFKIYDGSYERGKFFIVQYIFAYTYVIGSIIHAIVLGIGSRNYVDKSDLITVILFPLFPAIAGILQFFYPSLPLAAPAITLSMLLLYLNALENMISLDPLTGVGNRKRLMWMISKKMRDYNEGDDDIYILMIDANGFKQINDTYGHIEGDEALKRIARALKEASKELKKKPQVARFGGDEFVILAENDDEAEIDKVCTRIHEVLKVINEEYTLPYKLEVSIGKAKYLSSIKTVKEFIDAADDELYKVKKALKVGR